MLTHQSSSNCWQASNTRSGSSSNIQRLKEHSFCAGVFEPEALIGRHVVVVANLAPRKMRFGVSEGMVLASGPGGEDIFLLSPDEGATPGMRVK